MVEDALGGGGGGSAAGGRREGGVVEVGDGNVPPLWEGSGVDGIGHRSGWRLAALGVMHRQLGVMRRQHIYVQSSV